MYKLYVLKDPRDNEVRYVGITRRTLLERYSEHINKYDLREKKKDGWIATLKLEGQNPIIQALFELPVSPEQAAALEIKWIADLRAAGCDLTNVSKGGQLGCKRTKEDIERADAQQKLRADRIAERAERRLIEAKAFEEYREIVKARKEEKQKANRIAHEKWVRKMKEQFPNAEHIQRL